MHTWKRTEDLAGTLRSRLMERKQLCGVARVESSTVQRWPKCWQFWHQKDFWAKYVDWQMLLKPSWTISVCLFSSWNLVAFCEDLVVRLLRFFWAWSLRSLNEQGSWLIPTEYTNIVSDAARVFLFPVCLCFHFLHSSPKPEFCRETSGAQRRPFPSPVGFLQVVEV